MKTIKMKVMICLMMILSLPIPFFPKTDKINGETYGQLKTEIGPFEKQKIIDYFNYKVKNKDFIGTVIIAQEGQIILEKGFGMANYEECIPDTPSTVYAIASMTKAFTSMSIMMLEERGLLSTDDLVSKYIPEYPEGNRITIHQLLGMTAGVPDFIPLSIIWDNISKFHTPEELLDSFINLPLDFDPGTKWEYCNSCYILLGIIIERVSGMRYGDFLQANIFKPLKMENTSYDPYGLDFKEKKAVAYDSIKTDPPTIADYLHPSVAYSAGGIFTDINDMYLWDQALYTETLVSSTTLQKIFTPGLWGYGYGWWIDSININGQKHKRIWHFGSYLGYHSFISRLVDDKITIILLENFSLPSFSSSATDDPSEMLQYEKVILNTLFDTHPSRLN